jgi:hypothetical protein
MAENRTHLARVANDLCFFRGCTVDSVNHPTAMYQMNCGNRFGGDPGIGALVNYGLGSINQDLPGFIVFIVLPEVSYPQGGAANWSNGYLPAHSQGTPPRPKGSPILDLQPPPGVTRERQRKNLDAQHPGHDELAARKDSYELAFRMQMQVPEVLDLSREDARTRERFGSARTPPMPLAANASSPASSSRKVCALCSSTMAPGTATTASSAPTAISSAAWTAPSPP